MNLLTQAIAWVNSAANWIGGIAFAPARWMPGWLSLTIIAAVSGVITLYFFKHTSNQSAIKRVRSKIKANLLALKLFKESPAVAIQSQIQILNGASRLMLLSIVPILVMTAPITFLLAQMSLWYESRPLKVGEEAVLTLKTKTPASDRQFEVSLEPNNSVAVAIGPIRIQSKSEFCWQIRAAQNGQHVLRFQVKDIKRDGSPANADGGLRTYSVEKSVAVSDQFLQTSSLRPAWRWSDVLLYPAEPAFKPDSVVESIDIVYPKRTSYVYGSGWWVLYWSLASMVFAFCFRNVLRVHI